MMPDRCLRLLTPAAFRAAGLICCVGGAGVPRAGNARQLGRSCLRCRARGVHSAG
jgi:hypothetical protein